jgi:hypothetical protein
MCDGCYRPDRPFAEWDSEAICGYLQELGLDCYANDAKRWVKSGTQLLQASNHELEKELGIKVHGLVFVQEHRS